MTKTLIAHIGVDSGQIMIADPCYIKDGFDNEFDPETKGQDKQPHYEMNYDGCCNATLSENGYGQLGNDFTSHLGLACRTAYGDGVYPIYAEYNGDGTIKTLTIDFDPTPESELCSECGEDLYYNDCGCED